MPGQDHCCFIDTISIAMRSAAQCGLAEGRASTSSVPNRVLDIGGRTTRETRLLATGKMQAGSRTVKQKTQTGKQEGTTGTQGTKGTSSKAYTFITGFPFPLGPAFQRDTIRYEVEKDTMWIFEQTQALENVSVYTPVRMTVIKLSSGGLWVHAPVAPTDECIRMVKELGAPVEYIVLSTFAYEHKAFVGPFSRKFPKAKVYVTPYQWSFPLNLPNQFFGISPAGELSLTEEGMPWADDIAQRLLLPPSIGIGEYARQPECAFFHKKSKTLMVTDSVVCINDNVPEVIPTEALLESARDGWINRFRAGDRTPEEVKAIARTEPREDTPENRIRGWRRMSLLVLYFNPANLLEPDASFEAISDRLICPPVVETLVYSKIKASVRKWVDSIVSDWNFTRVIPCHFDAPVRTSPADFKRAFAFAYEDEEEAEGSASASQQPSSPTASNPFAFLGSLFGRGASAASTKPTRPVVFPDADIKTLRDIDNILLKTGLIKANADA